MYKICIAGGLDFIILPGVAFTKNGILSLSSIITKNIYLYTWFF